MIDPEAPQATAAPSTDRPRATTVSGLFLAALRAAPDRTVLAMEQASLTYDQASDWSKTLARYLTEKQP